jgi:hypothetical protein
MVLSASNVRFIMNGKFKMIGNERVAAVRRDKTGSKARMLTTWRLLTAFYAHLLPVWLSGLYILVEKFRA